MAITQVSNSLVKQDLTISGGTVDNTVIGSGTPAAGTFTTVAGTLASTVTGTTAAASDNSTKIATTAYVTTAIANLVDTFGWVLFFSLQGLLQGILHLLQEQTYILPSRYNLV